MMCLLTYHFIDKTTRLLQNMFSWIGLLPRNKSFHRSVLLTVASPYDAQQQMIGLFCKRALFKRRYSAKETYDFKEPTNRSLRICRTRTSHRVLCVVACTAFCVPWRIHMCDRTPCAITRWHMSGDSFTRVTWIIHTCDMTQMTQNVDCAMTLNNMT